VYVDEGVVPAKYRTDGLHIATAAVNELDIIVSMNFSHIVKRKTKLATPTINALRGYRAVEIYNPMELIHSLKRYFAILPNPFSSRNGNGLQWQGDAYGKTKP
jgi:hypothetical protein